MNRGSFDLELTAPATEPSLTLVSDITAPRTLERKTSREVNSPVVATLNGCSRVIPDDLELITDAVDPFTLLVSSEAGDSTL